MVTLSLPSHAEKKGDSPAKVKRQKTKGKSWLVGFYFLRGTFYFMRGMAITR
jgi:hypothetical protein